MDSQVLISVLVPIISLVSAVVVVLISSVSSLMQKRIEVEQRQADYRQELRKAFVLKRIEAGEELVTRYSTLMHKLDWIWMRLLSIDWDAEFQSDFGRYLDGKFAKITDQVDSILDLPTGRTQLFFDEEIEREANIAGLQVMALEKKLMGSTIHNTDREVLKSGFAEYEAAIIAYRVKAAGVIAAVRREVAQYGSFEQ